MGLISEFQFRAEFPLVSSGESNKASTVPGILWNTVGMGVEEPVPVLMERIYSPSTSKRTKIHALNQL